MLRGASGIKFLNLSVVEMTAVMEIGKKISHCISMNSYSIPILNILQEFFSKIPIYKSKQVQCFTKEVQFPQNSMQA